MHSTLHSTVKADDRQTFSAWLPLFRVSLWFCLLAMCVGFGPPIITDGDRPPLRLAPENVDALVHTHTVPSVTALSALVVDSQTGLALYEKDSTQTRPPASTAKLMTALVVIDQVPLDDIVVVSQAAAGVPGSRMGLNPGDRFTVRELLHGLLIPSGNDAAVALAEHVAGTQADFVDLMNTRASAMGLTSTHFANVHGLDAEGQLTSATDLAELARVALQDPIIASIVQTRSVTIGGYQLQNTNELLGSYTGTNGVKTGTTDEAGECLVASVARNGRTTLLVELGSADRFGDARKLLDYTAEAFSWLSTGLPSSALAWVAGDDDHYYRLRSGSTSDIVVSAWQRSLVLPIVRIDTGVVVTSTAPVGELRWMLGSEPIAAVPLFVLQGP